MTSLPEFMTATGESAEPIQPLTNYQADVHMLSIAITSQFLSSYLSKLHLDFSGDLIMGFVFTELSMRNISRILPMLTSQQIKQSEKWQTVLDKIDAQKITPCNVLSISEATGIPRETVRRKISKLEEMGWIVREGRDKWVLARKPVALLLGPSKGLVEEFVESSRKVQSLIATMACHQRM